MFRTRPRVVTSGIPWARRTPGSRRTSRLRVRAGNGSRLPGVPDLSVRCPGATLIAGPEPIGPSVVCGPLANDRMLEDQGRFRGSTGNVVFTVGKDPSVVRGSCCGSYTACGIWRAEKDRIRESRSRLDPDEG